MVNLPEESLMHSEPEDDGVSIFFCNEYPAYSLIPSLELKDLELLSEMAGLYSVLRQYSTNPFDPHIQQHAMNRLRHLFNMEFKMRCHKCGKAHYQDEISAPER